ncbi:hypothetical protein GM3709_3044 [Geminocystis sp. NIES-3709]|nr:hypothetical protein GM3709_3044 [Geminocystis sp. NIES-3709]
MILLIIIPSLIFSIVKFDRTHSVTSLAKFDTQKTPTSNK